MAYALNDCGEARSRIGRHGSAVAWLMIGMFGRMSVDGKVEVVEMMGKRKCSRRLCEK